MLIILMMSLSGPIDSNDDRLEDKRQNNQNCSVLYCM